MNYFKDAKVGDKVWHYVFGEGLMVEKKLSELKPIAVEFIGGLFHCFYLNGTFGRLDKVQSLFYYANRPIVITQDDLERVRDSDSVTDWGLDGYGLHWDGYHTHVVGMYDDYTRKIRREEKLNPSNYPDKLINDLEELGKNIAGDAYKEDKYHLQCECGSEIDVPKVKIRSIKCKCGRYFKMTPISEKELKEDLQNEAILKKREERKIMMVDDNFCPYISSISEEELKLKDITYEITNTEKELSERVSKLESYFDKPEREVYSPPLLTKGNSGVDKTSAPPISEKERNLIYRLHKRFPNLLIAYSELDYGKTHLLWFIRYGDNMEENPESFYMSGITYDGKDGKMVNAEPVGFSAGKTEDEMFDYAVSECGNR